MWGRLTVNHVRSLRPVTEASARAVAEWKARGSRRPHRGARHVRARRRARARHGPPAVLRPARLPDVFVRLAGRAPGAGRERRVVLFDFFGFGLSAKPDVRYSIRRYADQAAQVARYAGLESVVLLTHDMGDTVGGELLARELEGSWPVDDHATRPHQRQHLHRDGAPHAGPAVPAVARRRAGRAAGGTDDPGANFKAGVGGTFAARTRRPTTRSPRNGSSSRTTPATRSWRAPSATSKIGAPRNHGSRVRSRRTRRRWVSCGGPRTRSPWSR